MDGFTYTITLVVGIVMGIVSLVIIAGAIYAIGIWYPRQLEQRNAELKARGRLGEATILRLPRAKMSGAGSSALYRLVSIGLEVRVPGVEVFEIDKVFTLPTSSLRHLELGKKVPVWIDPNNPRNLDAIVIDVE